MELQLLIGLIVYILCIGALTCWILRYHLEKERLINAEIPQNGLKDVKDFSNETNPILVSLDNPNQNVSEPPGKK